MLKPAVYAGCDKFFGLGKLEVGSGAEFIEAQQQDLTGDQDKGDAENGVEVPGEEFGGEVRGIRTEDRWRRGVGETE